MLTFRLAPAVSQAGSVVDSEDADAHISVGSTSHPGSHSSGSHAPSPTMSSYPNSREPSLVVYSATASDSRAGSLSRASTPASGASSMHKF